jgi:hypothetical protein
MSSYSLIDPDLDHLIGMDTAAEVALCAAEAAVAGTGLRDLVVGEALSAIRGTRAANLETIRASVLRRVEALDQEYLELYEEAAGVLEPAVTRAFSRARAAAAVAEALRSPSPESAGDALYEAHAALGDEGVAELLLQVRRLLGPNPRRVGGVSGA